MNAPSRNISLVDSVMRDEKSPETWDVIRVVERLDEAPVVFDFGAGNIFVFRFAIEVFDAKLTLFVPGVNSFLKKIEPKKFYELGAKRTFRFLLNQEGDADWLIYVNRIKNLNPIELSIKDRLRWKEREKKTVYTPQVDSFWRNRTLPPTRLLSGAKRFFERIQDIDPKSLLSPPIKVLRLKHSRQIELVETTGSVIKNHEYLALNFDGKMIRLYVPYFLIDMIALIRDYMPTNNLIINRLKIFFKRAKNHEPYVGFLWDPTLSGFAMEQKQAEDFGKHFDAAPDYLLDPPVCAAMEQLAQTDQWQPKQFQLDDGFFDELDEVDDLVPNEEDFAESNHPRKKRNIK